MPRLTAEGGIDFFRRAHNNVMSYFDGRCVLTSKNKMPNPDLRDFDPEGRLDGWDLLAPPRPDHWNVYVKQLTRVLSDGSTVNVSEPFLRQNTSKLGMEEKTFTIEDPLLSGTPITDATKKVDFAAPLYAPDARAAAGSGALGWAGGTWWFSYCWIMGQNPTTSWMITNAAPAKSLVLSQGQMPQITMPGSPPEGATGIALIAGKTATTMSIQKMYDTRATVPETVVLDYFRDGGTVKTSNVDDNTTYNGDMLDWPWVWWSRSSGTFKGGTITRFAYKILTEQGWSMVSFFSRYTGAQGWSPMDDWPGWTLCWLHADNIPENALRWLPLFEGDDMNWYTIPMNDYAGMEGLPIGTPMCIDQNYSDQDSWTYGGKPQQVELNGPDETGIPGPEEALELLAVGGIALTPGTYAVKTTLGLDDEESSPSPQTVVTLAHAGGGVTSQIISVSRPSEQMLKNNRVTEKTPQGTDLFWTTPVVAGVTVNQASTNEVTVVDRFTGSTDSVVKHSDMFPIETTYPITVRAFVEVTARSAGGATVAIEMYNSGGGLTGTHEFTQQAAVGVREHVVGIGPGESLAFAANTTQVRFVIKSKGSAARNLDYRVYHMAVYRGANATKRYPLTYDYRSDSEVVDRRSAETERKLDSYPNGPYCRVVQVAGATNPAGIAGNYVEYWAPKGQPKLFNNFMKGMKIPLKRNQAYKLSVYIENRSVASGTAPFVTSIRDETGRLLVNNGPIATLSGTTAWTRRNITVPANSEAAYLQFEGGFVGEGMIRAAGFQLEEGTTVTAFDNTNATTGFFDVAFNTKGETMVAPIMEKVTAFVRGQAVATQEWPGTPGAPGSEFTDVAVTQTSNEYRCADTEVGLDSASWYSSLSDMVTAQGLRQYVEVRTNMSTSNATKSPVVRAVFLDVKRHRPMLYKADGSPFPGGVLVTNFPAPQKIRNVVIRDYADGSRGFDDVGRGNAPVTANGWNLMAFDDDAVTQIADMMGKEDGLFIVEREEMRYQVRFFNAYFAAERSQWKKIEGKMYWVHTATGIEAQVLGESSF